MPVLAVLQPNPRTVALLRDALAVGYDLQTVRSWEELLQLMRTGWIDGCIVDPYDTGREIPFEELREVRRRFPAIAIVVHADFEGREVDLYELGRLEVDGAIVVGRTDSRREIRRTVGDALSLRIADRVAGALEGSIHPLLVRCLRWSVRYVESGADTDRMGSRLFDSSRRLRRILLREGLPPPRSILVWARLIRAFHRIETDAATVEEAAYTVGYSSAAALRRALRSTVDATPTEVIGRGGVSWLIQCAREHLAGRPRSPDTAAAEQDRDAADG